MVRIGTFLLGGLLGLVAAQSVIELNPDNFDEIVTTSNKWTLVKFYAQWCSHCKNLAPTFEELADAYAYTDKVQIAKLDADTHKALGKKYNIQGYPTLYLFDGKSEHGQTYSEGRTLDDFKRALFKMTGVQAQAKYEPPSSIKYLTDADFDRTIGGDQDVFVAFTAPWCGHCKNLAPTWEKLASDFSTENSVIIAKVDADSDSSRTVAAEQGIKSFPTIKFFSRGQKEGELYSGGRTEEALVEFVNGKAGTLRRAGGKLSEKAGLIAELDEIVAKFTSGGKLADAASHAKKAANALQGQAQNKYAEYYVRVFKKLQENEEYVTKEIARLSSILAKGNLAQEKVDDMTCKTNILAKFTEKPAPPRADVDEEENVKDEL